MSDLLFSTPLQLGASGSHQCTLTRTGSPAANQVATYLYQQSFRLSECCTDAEWNAFVARVPGWSFDVPQWKRSSIVSLQFAHRVLVRLTPRENGLLSPAFANAVSVIAARGDSFPSSPCGLALGLASLEIHARYEHGQCAIYEANFQAKGQCGFSATGAPFPENPAPWVGGGGFCGDGQQARQRYVAYGIQSGKLWFSSPLELEFSASSEAQQITEFSYMYSQGLNTINAI